MQEAYINGFWDEIVAYTRALFNNTFKTNPYLERAVMTGITRVSKESIFSDLNNLTVVTTTSDRYATCFGFTEEEVFAAMDAQGIPGEEKENVKFWYDGFTFGTVRDIYNPWSVTLYLDERKYDTHWANTSGNGLVGKLIREGDKTIKIEFEKLLKGETIEAEIDEQIIFSQLEGDINAIWSLLLASGYLKVEGIIREHTNDTPVYQLKLTNFEVKRMFEKMVKGWFARSYEFNEFDTYDQEKTLEDTAVNALKQIEDKKYDTDLLQRGIPADHIYKYGFAFEGEKCLIKKAEVGAPGDGSRGFLKN